MAWGARLTSHDVQPSHPKVPQQDASGVPLRGTYLTRYEESADTVVNEAWIYTDDGIFSTATFFTRWVGGKSKKSPTSDPLFPDPEKT